MATGVAAIGLLVAGPAHASAATDRAAGASRAQFEPQVGQVVSIDHMRYGKVLELHGDRVVVAPLTLPKVRQVWERRRLDVVAR